MIWNNSEFEKFIGRKSKGGTACFILGIFFRKIINPFSQTNGDRKTLRAGNNIPTKVCYVFQNWRCKDSCKPKAWICGNKIWKETTRENILLDYIKVEHKKTESKVQVWLRKVTTRSVESNSTLHSNIESFTIFSQQNHFRMSISELIILWLRTIYAS